VLIFLVIHGGGGIDGIAGQTATEVFSDLYEKYLPKVFSFVSYRVEEKEIAEDITSSIFEKAVTKFNSYDANKAAFSTWIFTIARNAIIDYYRNRDKEQEYRKEAKIQIMVFSTSIEEEVTRTEDIKKLKTCLKKLGEKEQEIITLKFSSEMNNREIAGVMGLSESNVGTILCRAIKKLREEFTGWQHE
jgi:RNA polymerase sigma factor (sigma-70 family)